MIKPPFSTFDEEEEARVHQPCLLFSDKRKGNPMSGYRFTEPSSCDLRNGKSVKCEKYVTA